MRILSAKLSILLLHGLLLAMPGLAFAQPLITFYEKEEAAPANAQKLKTLTLTGNNPEHSCAGYELRLNARDSAAAMGANLIKIELQREHTQKEPCDEISFSFYRVPDLRSAERKFSWSAGRPLSWSDFKGPVPQTASPATVAETSCGIGIETNTVTDANTPKVYVYNTFQATTSWVRAADSSVDVLEHEQCHWDICELYTRKMRLRFAAAQLDVGNLRRVVSRIFNETQREYAARQQRYENETRHGIVREEQRRWTQMISNELATTDDL